MLKSFNFRPTCLKSIGSAFYRKRSLFFFLITACFIQFALTAQEIPPIHNYSPIDYGAENQNWGVAQSEQKNIYVANNGGLLEFNGATWQLYPSPNGSVIRSVSVIDDKVYTGCYMDFGFWERDNKGGLLYHSISKKSKLPLIEDEEIWNILGLDDWVLFQTLERIYIYNKENESLITVDSKSTKAHMFGFEGSVYFHSTGKGLFKIENGQPVLVSEHPAVKNFAVVGIFSIRDKTVVVTERGEFYFLQADDLTQWNIPFNKELEFINVYSSLQLEDKSVVLGTISNGIYHIDENGVLLRKISQERGLNNNTVLSIFEDEDHNLWLALDNGISLINLNSPFEEYIDKNGKLGVVYTSAIFNDYLYLGTNQGLFYKRVGDDSSFKIIDGSQGQVWILKVIDDVLFCGHNNGTYIVTENQVELVSDFPGTWDIKPIPNHDNLLLQGNFKGFSVLSKNRNGWALRNVIEGFDISSRFFEFIGENKVAVNREFKGIFKLALNDNYTRVIEVKNEQSKGFGASLAIYKNEVLYTCTNGIYKYDDKQEGFVNDTLLTTVFYESEDKPIGIYIPDEESERLWGFTDSNIVYASAGKFDTTASVSKIPIPTYVRKNLGVLGFENLTPLGNERYLIGISNGYLTIDLRKLISKEYTVHINSISRKSNDSEIERIPRDSTVVFDYSQNNLFFSYNVPQFDKYTEVDYQYHLEGIYEDWSELANTSNVSFENLPSGDYAFRVRAKIGNDFSSNIASYNFRIERPWYLSTLAIWIYVTGFIMAALAVHKLYKNYYKKQREQLLKESKKKLKRKKLKTQKKIVQINNEKLKEEVESKNRELAISTMSIIKKNEFLNAIKEQLKNSEQNPQVKSVIRTIDRNINNSDDWKFFEDAFNNADKDFLKKIKSVHTELTANDLRLCAYLRLNLSSKEIAPLLNISVRSVEVKRYRLRKKMELPHEEVLVDYIMQI